jgi:hypothetical protein
MRTHALLIALALVGCDDPAPAPSADTAQIPATAAPTGVTTSGPTSPASAAPTAVSARSVEPAPSAAASASAVSPDASAASPPAAPAPATLLGAIARARKVKVTAVGDAPLEVEIGEAEAIAALFASIGIDQELTDGCPSCVPAVRFVFSDAFGTRLGSLGWRCGDDETLAVVHDALANVCKRVTVADVEALRRIVDDLAE